jgi:hypothetical protein
MKTIECDHCADPHEVRDSHEGPFLCEECCNIIPLPVCMFPNCGCDGARLCMAVEPSRDALSDNVEGMWSGKSKAQRRARVGMLKYAIKDGAPK